VWLLLLIELLACPFTMLGLLNPLLLGAAIPFTCPLLEALSLLLLLLLPPLLAAAATPPDALTCAAIASQRASAAAIDARLGLRRAVRRPLLLLLLLDAAGACAPFPPTAVAASLLEGGCCCGCCSGGGCSCCCCCCCCSSCKAVVGTAQSAKGSQFSSFLLHCCIFSAGFPAGAAHQTGQQRINTPLQSANKPQLYWINTRSRDKRTAAAPTSLPQHQQHCMLVVCAGFS
jgi:hypothetical protein